MLRALIRSVALAALAACSIPETAFRASLDAAPALGDDDPLPSVLGIVVSAPAIELDEGASADFTVKLSQAPSAPLEIDLSTAAPGLGLSTQKLFFDATNFDAPQPVTVSGAADDDTQTEIDEIALAGTGVETVKVGATVHDNDKVTLVVDQTDTITVTEGTSTDVHVHLSKRPPGDVAVTALLGAGPVTIDPPSHVFHVDDYATDVTFTLSAAIDANAADESPILTFGIDGGDKKLITVVADDRDMLAIVASPTSIPHLGEGDSVTLNLTLTRQPTAPVTVKIETTTGKVQLGSAAVTFLATGNDYMVNHPVTLTAPSDTNTTSETDTIKLSVAGAPEITGVSISVHIDDSDVQAIQTTVTNSLTVTERSSAPFGVTLKFAPSGTFTVNLSTADSQIATAASSTGANFLGFTATNYNDPAAHQVIVSGSNDNNLVTNSTLIKLIAGTLETDVAVDVSDADQEAFVLAPATPLSIAEGGTGSFTVALKFQPTAAVHAVLSSTVPGALPVTPGFIDFSTTNWQTPVTVQIKPPIDPNNVAETATISVTAAPIPAASVMATVVDPTHIDTYGWPDPLATTYSILQGQIFAFPVTVPTSTLDSFGIYVPTASGEFRMALYQDLSGRPGPKVAGTDFAPRPLSNGTTITDITDVQIPAGTYWIALRVGATTSIGAGNASQTGMQCLRNTDIISLINDWPVDFGPATCAPGSQLFNLSMTTYHQ